MMSSATMTDTCWAHKTASAEQIKEWIRVFHRDGFLFLENVLTPEMCQELKDDLDKVCPVGKEPIELAFRLFETSRANRDLFDLEPIVSFAEELISEDHANGKEGCHVIHNNSFRTARGGGFAEWHQDDSSHYIVTHGEPPTNVHLPVLFFTANYYLTDVTDVSNGPGQAIPGSHLFGKRPPADLKGTKYESQIVSCLGKAGSVMLFNNQTWHRGAPNTSDRTRYLTQITYARRIIGHTYSPYVDYHMPEHVYAGASPRRKRLMGFKPMGAYG
jgi:ectoine hydroxylase-related dioxygenase (phytanoyl-CoA dioxygenase family)